MIYDGFIFSNELDVLEIHLNVLNDYVDKFILVESNRTFTNKPKDFIFLQNRNRFKEFLDKIIYIQNYDITGNVTWENEKCQRDRIMKGFENADPEDFIIIGDVDEICDPKILENVNSYNDSLHVLETYCYYYFLNYQIYPTELSTARSIILGKKKFITTPQAVRHERFNLKALKAGWHFSYLGGVDEIVKKLESFSHTEYDTTYYKDRTRLKNVLDAGTDLFGRNMTFRKVEFQEPYHPKWLIENRNRYSHLIK